MDSEQPTTSNQQGFIAKTVKLWDYCSKDVWSDTRPLWWVNVIKTLNITVRSFLNADVQTRACALTYRTMLAIVPALALLFAIGRGFGFQSLLQDELFKMFPSQHEAVTHALQFVDSYLSQASEGIFVGIGIVFLLWTLISLVSSVEDSFNKIWNIREGRSIWRQITDYTAMFLILPVLMICAGGFSAMVSSTLRGWFDLTFISPLLTYLFEAVSLVFIWLFYTAVFMLIPNTKVKFKYAFVAGVFTGTAFMILQWLFVTGQLYVAKYNAIYGSFSFLPLFLLWMQLVWVITLAGMLICYASQNIFRFSFDEQVSQISREYFVKVAVAICAVIVDRFESGGIPVTEREITEAYGVPSRLVSTVIDRLHRTGVISQVVIDEPHQIFGYQPGVPTATFTLATLLKKLDSLGERDFIPDFKKNFHGVNSTLDELTAQVTEASDCILVRDLKIKHLNVADPNITSQIQQE